jgi:hypothetical protein
MKILITDASILNSWFSSKLTFYLHCWTNDFQLIWKYIYPFDHLLGLTSNIMSWNLSNKGLMD